MNDEVQLMEAVHQINNELLKRLTPIFREKKVSVAEISVLLRMNRKPSSRATELATMIGIPTSTVTGIIDRLEKRGLVARRQDPEDRRSIQITATARTRGFVAELMTPMQEMLRKAFRSMPASRTRRLLQDLHSILTTLEGENAAAQ